MLWATSQPTVLQAQPPVLNDSATEDPVPLAGTTMLITSLDVSALSQGDSGADVLWDFSSIDDTDVQSAQFVDLATTPYAGDFANANMVLEYPEGLPFGSFEAAYEFFNVSTTGLDKLGLANNATVPVTVSYSDTKQLLTYPFGLGDTHTDTYEATFVSNGSTVVETGSLEAIADAYGTLLLPNGGSIDNVVRVFFNESYTQSIEGFPNTFDYTVQTFAWYHPNLAYPIFTIIIEELEGSPQTSTIARYMLIDGFSDEIITGLGGDLHLEPTNNNQALLAVYPNPCSSFVQLNFRQPLTAANTIVQVFNNTGQLVHTSVQATNGQHTLQIPTHMLANGAYTIHVSNGAYHINKKLVVLR